MLLQIILINYPTARRCLLPRIYFSRQSSGLSTQVRLRLPRQTLSFLEDFGSNRSLTTMLQESSQRKNMFTRARITIQIFITEILPRWQSFLKAEHFLLKKSKI